MALLAHQASLLVGIMKNHPGLIKERQVMDYRQLADPTAMSVNEVLDQAHSLEGEEVCIYGYFVGQFEHVALHHLPSIEARPPKEAEWAKFAGQDLLGSCIWVATEKLKNLEASSRKVVYITGTVQFARWRIPPKLRWIATTYPRLFQLCWPEPFAQLGHFGRYPAAIKVAKVRAFENSELLYERPNDGGKAT
jgi:hypothetical protein